MHWGSNRGTSNPDAADDLTTDVLMSGWLLKYSDIRWKHKYAVVRFGEVIYSASPHDDPRRFKRLQLTPTTIVTALTGAGRKTSFETSTRGVKGTRRLWRAKTEDG